MQTAAPEARDTCPECGRHRIAPLPDRRQVAEFLGMSVEGLAQLHYRGEGPPSITLGKRTVRYEWDDVLAWLKTRRSSKQTSA